MAINVIAGETEVLTVVRLILAAIIVSGTRPARQFIRLGHIYGHHVVTEEGTIAGTTLELVRRTPSRGVQHGFGIDRGYSSRFKVNA